MIVLKKNKLVVWVASAGDGIEESRGGGSKRVMKTNKLAPCIYIPTGSLPWPAKLAADS